MVTTQNYWGELGLTLGSVTLAESGSDAEQISRAHSAGDDGSS